jgi:hypothetical protein
MMLKDYVLKYYPESFQKLLAIDESYFPAYQNLLDYNFTQKENTQKIEAFEREINALSGDNYLLSRDLFCVDHPKQFDLLIDRGEDVILHKLKGWKTGETFRQSEAFQKHIDIAEMHTVSTVIPIDDIDDMIFYQLQEPRSYSELMQNMVAQLDEDAQEIIPQFVMMIRDRILYFLTHKVLRFTLPNR